MNKITNRSTILTKTWLHENQQPCCFSDKLWQELHTRELTGTSLLWKFWWIQPGFRLIIALSLPFQKLQRRGLLRIAWPASLSTKQLQFCPYDPFPKTPLHPYINTPPHTTPHQLPYHQPHTHLPPFLPFPSPETGAYHVYQTVDPRDFPQTFKLTLTHSLIGSREHSQIDTKP